MSRTTTQVITRYFGHWQQTIFVWYKHFNYSTMQDCAEQQVWPDWAIFESYWHQNFCRKNPNMIGNFLGNFEKPHYYVKSAFAIFDKLGVLSQTSGLTESNRNPFDKKHTYIANYFLSKWSPHGSYTVLQLIWNIGIHEIPQLTASDTWV